MAQIIGLKGYVDWGTKTVEKIFTLDKVRLLNNLWDQVVLNTPVLTGLAMYSWRMTPNQRSSYKPILAPGDGELYDVDTGRFTGYTRVFPEPDKPDMKKFTKKWKRIVLFNNQDYVAGLNENEAKYYYQFIDNGIRVAIARTKTGKF